MGTKLYYIILLIYIYSILIKVYYFLLSPSPTKEPSLLPKLPFYFYIFTHTHTQKKFPLLLSTVAYKKVGGVCIDMVRVCLHYWGMWHPCPCPLNHRLLTAPQGGLDPCVLLPCVGMMKKLSKDGGDNMEVRRVTQNKEV